MKRGAEAGRLHLGPAPAGTTHGGLGPRRREGAGRAGSSRSAAVHAALTLAVERRRRDKINNWIVQLSKIIPDCNADNSKTGAVSAPAPDPSEKGRLAWAPRPPGSAH